MNQTSRTKKFTIIKKHITQDWLNTYQNKQLSEFKKNRLHYHKGWFSFEIEQINCCIKKDFLLLGEEGTKGMDSTKARKHAIELAIKKYFEKINKEYQKQIKELIRCKAPYSCRLVYTHHKTHKKTDLLEYYYTGDY